MSSFKYLSEKPVEELDFGHKEIYKSLLNIVTTCKASVSIGLIGRWGTGKSSIIAALKENLRSKERTQGVPVVVFDLWKHEADSLRIAFLKELVKQLKTELNEGSYLKKDFQENPLLDSHISITETRDFNFDTRQVWNAFKVLLAVLLASVLVACLVRIALSIFKADELFQQIFIKILTITTVFTIVGGIYQLFKDLGIKKSKSTTTARLSYPHEFENEFNYILSKLKNSRIVIVFDNLDRGIGRKAIEFISTIKTFLEPASDPKKQSVVAFLIPCDVEAINKHLIVNSEDIFERTYADEFLRKVFNTTIWIPDFYPMDLEKFAHKKLEQTQIEEFNNPYLAWLIVTVFRQNPRQIIQFINVLITNFLFIKERSLTGDLGSKDFYKHNVPQLAKFLLVQARFPEVIKKMSESRIYNFDRIQDAASSLPRYREFAQLLNDTIEIPIYSCEPFISSRISNEERRLPGVLALFKVMDEVGPDAEKDAEPFMSPEKILIFSELVRERLNDVANPSQEAAFLSSLFRITKAFEKSLPSSLYSDIRSKFELRNFNNIDRINPDDLASEFIEKAKIPEKTERQILATWINILSDFRENVNNRSLNEEREFQMIRQIGLRHTLCSDELRAKFRSTIALHYSGRNDILELATANQEAEDFFVTDDLLERCVKRFAPRSENKEIVKFFSNLTKGRLKNVNNESIVEVLEGIIKNSMSSNEINDKKNAIHTIMDIVDLFGLDLTQFTNKPKYTDLHQTVVAAYNSPDRMRIGVLYFPVALKMKKVLPKNYHGDYDSIINDFVANFGSFDEMSLEFVFQNTSELPDLLANTNYSIFQKLPRRNLSLALRIYPFINEDLRQKWILVILAGEDFITKMESMTSVINKYGPKELVISTLQSKKTTENSERIEALISRIEK